MNPEELNPKPAGERRAHYWKFVTAFLTIVVLVFTALWGLARYERYTGEQQVQRLADAMKQLEQDDYARAMADTYGGKTPKETLQLYISALEKRDFALASQYFIGDNKEKEARRWDKTTDARINEVIDLLKQAMNDKEDCNEIRTGCAFHKPILVDFKLYPNGVWKLIEI